ncbi:hypothetical protein QJ857_gp0798 [Tupanvirus soda lake]|uniref:Uncharacterized protein n=2 Tax=Tupanvirus TaxID=2094720 RepID=A0A6N1P2J8_9VIRU|nr:hypothetical protein QJ857_gp0798 [Tupanvirus soda lake]QKU35251.1 hypothetical protein [Tupanvirus soda lake]
MEFLSDFARTNNLLNTDEMTSVEFSEDYGSSGLNDRHSGNARQSNEDKNNNTWEAQEENLQRYTGYNINDRNDPQYQQDYYAKKQERGNRRAESLSDERNWNYNVDYMDNEGSKRHRGIETDFRWQTGGKEENLNYLDDYTSAQYNSKRLDSYEKEFFAIYNKAREFRQRIMDIEKQKGGQDVNKPKRAVNKTLALMLELSKNMKDSGKFPNIQQKHFMKISKMIVDEAKRQTGTQEVNDSVRQAALQLVKNAEPFVAKFRSEQSQNQGSQLSEGNTRTRSGNYKNSRNNTNGNNRNRRRFNGDNDDNSMGSNFSDLTDNFSEKRTNSGNNRGSDQNYPWKGSNSNYRNYAQSNLWRDVPEWRNTQSNFTDTQRFSGDAQDYLNSPSGSKYYSQYNRESGNDRTLDRYGNTTTFENINAVPGNRTGTANESHRGSLSSNERNSGSSNERNSGSSNDRFSNDRFSNRSIDRDFDRSNDENNQNGPIRDSRNMLENDRRQNTYGTSGALSQSQNNTTGMSMDRVRMMY